MDALSLTAQLQSITAKAARPAGGELVPAGSGNALPAEGKSAPEPASAPKIDIPEVSIEQVVAQIQEFISQSQRDLEFRVDDSTGRTVVSVFGGNGELIRQFPSAEILKIVATLQEQGLNLLDQSV